jgi:cytochrome c oxidase subunit 1
MTNHISILWARRWLMLGVSALAIAGLFSLILVIARTPQLAAFKELFSVALVIHVDLSVLVWFLAVMCTGLSLFISKHEQEPLPVVQPTAWWSAAAGTVLITISPLTGEWEVIKSNYVPVLFNMAFFLGLTLFAAAILMVSLHAVWVCLATLTGSFHRTVMREKAKQEAASISGSAQPELDSSLDHEVSVTDIGWVVTGLLLLLSLFMFFMSGDNMPAGLPHDQFYELLFWAGGHTLQFAYTTVMMLAWLALAARVISKPIIHSCVLLGLWVVALGAAMVPLYGYLEYTVDDQAFINLFTDIMIKWGGVAPTFLFIVIGHGLLHHRVKQRDHRALTSSLIMSMVLFAAGGLLGLMIQGQNVTIPAHYHGAIVGVTLALMGYAYTLLPTFGYKEVASWRLAYWQPILYGVGQLMHIGGLAYSGGYGVLRKTAAAGQDYAPEVKVALGFMGLGGMLAIIGGLMFVIVVWKATRAQG